MRDVLPQIEAWHTAGEAVALATVVRTWGSSPRPAGSAMAVAEDGFVGSVSGGCVESAVIGEARECLADGQPRLLEYGVADEAAWEVGLPCGGRVEVLVTGLDPGDPILASLATSLASERTVALATDTASGRRLLHRDEGGVAGTLGCPALDAAATALLERAMASEDPPGRHEIAQDDERVDAFVAVYRPRPRLVVVGAVHVAVALVDFARQLGFRTVLVDPRRDFATRERFPTVDELIHDWPGDALAGLALDRHSYVASLSHDPKLDLPAIAAALASDARYVGALGSRRTHARRLEALRRDGVDEASLARISAPIGIDLGGRGGGRGAAEIALAIAAELVAVRHGVRDEGARDE